MSRTQIETMRRNAAEFGVRLHPLGDIEQGIVHVVGPQLGLTQPGMTIVCGDSHTSTHGAFGAIAFGIGTSEVEHVLATQTLMQAKPKTMAVTVNGTLPDGVTAKDLVLALITRTGTGGGQGYIVEYRGQAIEELSMEARMTICNMSIEWGAKAGMIAPDQTTFDYVEGRPEAPKGADWDAAVAYWKTLVTDDDAEYDAEIVVDAAEITPWVTWGTNPGQGVALGGAVPTPEDFEEPSDRVAAEKALTYMGLEAGTPMREVKVDTVFVGSCTNGRIEDLRLAASIIEGRHVDENTRMLVVPGSVRVRLQAEEEGLDVIFKEAGAEWRGAGCSMCLGMNPDTLERRRAQRVDVQPQLRGPPGQGRSHAPGLGPGRGGHRRPRHALVARRSRARPRRRRDGRVHQPHRRRGAAAPQQRRHRPDHPGGVPQAGHPHRLRGRPVLGLAQRPVVRAQPRGVRRRLGARGRTGLRHRLVPRARGVGAAWTTGSGSSSRRASATSSAATPARPGCSRRRSTRRSSSGSGTTSRTRPGATVTVDLESRTVRAGDGPDAIEDSFDIDDYTRWRLLEGLDDIGITLGNEADIATYEATRPSFKPVTL